MQVLKSLIYLIVEIATLRPSAVAGGNSLAMTNQLLDKKGEFDGKSK